MTADRRFRRRMRKVGVAPLVLLLLIPGAACQAAPPQALAVRGPGEPIAAADFALLVERLSGEAGYFDTDNLISNERSYLHVMGALEALGVGGGAYIGVGPDQNFSYIAAVRPRVAVIVDLRRDNLLQHLLFKAVFHLAETRVEYMSLLHGRAPPAEPRAWRGRDVDEVVAYVDASAPDPAVVAEIVARVDSVAASFPVELSEDDRATLRRFHGEFIREGLSLRFKTFGRAPRPYYPTYRQLVLERDLEGRRANYLADEEDYRFVRELQLRNLVVPVVGDLAGPHALRAIAAYLEERGERVSVLYVSNVEFYLFQDRSFTDFAQNVLALPIDERSVLVRSYFPSFGGAHPHAVAGYYSTQSLQTLQSFVDATRNGGYRGYLELTTRDAIDPSPRR